MKHYPDSIQHILRKQFEADGYDLVELIQIPKNGDRMLRIQTLEEALQEFDHEDSNDNQSMTGFIIQVRPKAKVGHLESPGLPSPPPLRAQIDGVYLQDGKLNIPYLSKNGELLYRSGEFTLAKNIFKTILQPGGDRTSYALHWLGKCAESEGKLDYAQKFYEESLVYQPNLEVYQQLASLLIRLHKDQPAAEILERALNLKSVSTDTLFDLHKTAGNCWTRCDQTQKAEAHYRKALEIDPSDDELYSNLGAIYLHLSRTADSRRYFDKAISLNPSNAAAWTGLGTCYFVEGNKQAAHDSFAKALDIQIKNPTAIFYLVKLSYELKSYSTAARILENYIDIAPVNAHLLYSLAGLQYHLGKIEDSKKVTQKILDLQPQHTGAQDLLKLIETMTARN